MKTLMKKKHIVITTLAVYQTKFWLAVANKLRSRGFGVAFISFDDLSSDMIRAENYPALLLRGLNAKCVKNSCVKLFDKCGVKNPSLIISHERLAFNINSSDYLYVKFLYYFSEVKAFLNNLKKSGDVVLFQELGGFTSVLASFHAAKAESVNNIFIEPSFFKGRQFFIKDSLLPKKIQRYKTSKSTFNNVSTLIQKIVQTKALVIPDKDRHHYSAAIKKITNFSNFKKLLFKIIQQKVLGRHFEFGYPLGYVKSHLRMLLNSLRNRAYYKKFDCNLQYIYFPLHVPGDAALTLRSPEYLDQLSAVDFIARNLPLGFSLLIKEHPAQIGALDGTRLRKMIRNYDQLHLIDPSTNNFDILKNASCVISINSKSGAEALLVGRQVIVLGKAFYSDCNLVHRLENFADINTKLNEILRESEKLCEIEIINYFCDVWRHSLPGELYYLDEQNIETFATSMVDFVR